MVLGNITVLETPILVLACATWDKQWSQKRIRIHSDDAATFAAVEQRRVKDDRLMDLRAIHFIEAKHNFLLSIEHIPGKENVMADAISREQFARFKEHIRVIGSAPSTIHKPVVIPESIPR